jgi:hypothetical protein
MVLPSALTLAFSVRTPSFCTLSTLIFNWLAAPGAASSSPS